MRQLWQARGHDAPVPDVQSRDALVPDDVPASEPVRAGVAGGAGDAPGSSPGPAGAGSWAARETARGRGDAGRLA